MDLCISGDGGYIMLVLPFMGMGDGGMVGIMSV